MPVTHAEISRPLELNDWNAEHVGDFSIETHSAPADGSLAAGELVFWFDQTNGAGKLMIKAKTANGTVVTGSVTLT